MVNNLSEKRVAYRYAKSILDLAREKGVLDEVYRDMGFFEKTLDENSELKAVMRNPIIYSYRKLSILKKLFEGKIHPVTMSFFEIIAHKNREEVLYAAAKEFEHLYEEAKGIQRATLTSAAPVTEELRQKAITLIKNATGKEVKLEEKIKPDLIGGFTITYDDEQIDASVRTKLKLLQTEFLTH
ncbi:MAG: F0F1 ATP synthase subunit delta [Raineya sp.]